jgi:hypothetical protein
VPRRPGWTLIHDLNEQFRNARVSNHLSSAGILVHVFDGISDAMRPWLPCKDIPCAKYADRFATSLLYPGHQDVYAGGAGGWQKGGGGGFVISTDHVSLNCAYYADGGSQGKLCGQGAGPECVPGCGRWCDPAKEWRNWGCAWQPQYLRQMIIQQEAVHPDGGYNEVIVNADSWVTSLPNTILAVFVCVASDGTAERGKIDNARRVHQQFLADYRMSQQDFPLLLMDEGNSEYPFRIMPENFEQTHGT